ncbi:MAG: mechanosensitive ion channel family protein [Thaumarchaeota archaeon]|nr:mechanosensitive ion channel family protein [Nitrososphaerota archaeon]
MALTFEEEVVGSVLTIVATFLLTQGVSFIIRKLAKRAGAKPPVLRSLRDVFALVWVLLTTIGILTITGLSSEFTTLTFSGIAGIAVTLALQSTLSNLIAGILLFHDRVIRLDDKIQFGGITGTIILISLRATWVRTEEGNIVVIGNNNLSNGPLVNFSAGNRLTYLSGETAQRADPVG